MIKQVKNLMWAVGILLVPFTIAFADGPKASPEQGATLSGAISSASGKLSESVLAIELPDAQLDKATGKKFSLGNEKRPIVVLFFLGLQCPVANTYVSEVRDLQTKFEKEKTPIA